MLLLASYANNLIPWQGNKVGTTILSLATLQMKMLKQTESILSNITWPVSDLNS